MIIKRYLAREVITTALAVVTVLLLAFVSQQLVRYLNYVAVGKIPTSVLFQLVGFEIPYLFALLLPLALYLGILLAFGRLYADNEMAMMHMCGFGERRVLRFSVVLATVIASLVMLLMLWMNPLISAERQKIMQSDEATGHLIQTMMPGRFQVSADGKHVTYVEKLSRDHQRAENVFLAEETPQAKDANKTTWMLVLANLGYQVKDKTMGDQFFVTANGYRYEGIPGQNDYTIIQFKKYAVRIPPSDLRITHLQDEMITSHQLLSDYDDPRRAAELQWRLSIGLSAIILALLAVPLSAIRPRQSRYKVLLPAVLIYIVYINLLFVARHWVEKGVVPIALGMWWVHGLLILLVVGALYLRSKQWTGKAV